MLGFPYNYTVPGYFRERFCEVKAWHKRRLTDLLVSRDGIELP